MSLIYNFTNASEFDWLLKACERYTKFCSAFDLLGSKRSEMCAVRAILEQDIVDMSVVAHEAYKRLEEEEERAKTLAARLDR